jgi:uncharacterized repeat protein (TIGR02543 family)
MRIFKTILSIILVMLIASCNVTPSTTSSFAVSSSQNSSTQVTTGVTSIEISSNSSLTQFIGLTSRVNVAAKLNSGAVAGTAIEWYVDNVRSLTQNGLTFEFFPTEVKTYQIQARVGGTVSNTLTVNVGLPRFNLVNVEVLSSTQISVRADAGISFAISGISLATTSNYNLTNQAYTLNLLSPMVQGTTYTLTASKPGFESTVYPLLYETRKLTVGSILYKGQRVLANTDGAYEIQKPFAGAAPQNYTISLAQTNLEGSSVPISIITNVPSGATAVAPFQSTITVQRGINITRDYTLSNTTEPGLYVHNISVSNVNVVVRIVVSNPSPSLTLTTPVVFDLAATSGGGTPLSSPFALDAEGDPIKKVVTPNAAGQYVITRPYNGSAFELTFVLTADNFPTPLGFPAGGNPYNIIAALSGPTGGIMNYGSTINNLSTTYPFRETTGSAYRITQYVDNKTALGSYTYNFTASGYNLNVTRSIVIVVRQFEPTIEPVISYGDEELKANSDGSFTIFKPLGTNTINLGIAVKVSNYESPLASSTAGGSGVSTLYSDGTFLRYLLDTRVSYSGPLSSVTALVTKIAIELGSNSSDTTVRAQNGTVDFNRYFGSGASETINLITLRDEGTYTVASNTSIFDPFKTLSATTFPGVHTFTVQIGGLTKAFILRVVETTPLIITRDNVVEYGPNGSESKDNVEYKASEDKYYVNGKGGDLKINVLPFGMTTGDYTYTFTRLTPSGSFQSTTNVSRLTLRVDVVSSSGPPIVYSERYDGTLKFPVSGAGSEMKVDETLTEEGEYVYTFVINNITKVIKVVVLAAPQLRVDKLTFNNSEVEQFNNRFFVNHSTSSRYFEVELSPVNIESTYKYVLNDTGVLPIGTALTAALQDLVIVNGKMVVGITVQSSTSTSEVVSTYLIALYKGSVQVGAVSKVVVVSQPLSSTIFFATNGGSTITPKNQFVGTAVSAPTPPTRTGYTFTSWHLNPALVDSNLDYSTYLMPTSDTVIYAKWTVVTYNITYNLNSGVNFANPPTTYTIETTTITLGTPTKDGSTFAGWFTTVGFTAGTQVTSIPLGSSGAITLYAKWNP